MKNRVLSWLLIFITVFSSIFYLSPALSPVYAASVTYSPTKIILYGWGNSTGLELSSPSYASIMNNDYPTSRFDYSFPLSLPTGIKITNATLSVRWFAHKGVTAYLGETRSSNDGNNNYTHMNITNQFSDYNGGSVTKNIATTTYAVDPTDTTYNTVIYTHLFSDLSYRPYLTLTYEYAPTIPTVTSPTSNSYQKDTVALSASSSVVGGAPITYSWYYSTDGTNYTHVINSTNATYNWTMPEGIPDGTKIYTRCYASANGVTSSPSGVIQFTKGLGPEQATLEVVKQTQSSVEATKLLTEVAKNASEEAKVQSEATRIVADATKISVDETKSITTATNTNVMALLDTINNLKNQLALMDGIINNLETNITNNVQALDKYKPDISQLYWTSGKTATRSAIEVVNITAIDDITSQDALLIRYKVNTGTYSEWVPYTPIVSVSLGEEKEQKMIEFQVKDLANNTSSKSMKIWKL